jgi:hypothetical protein
MKIESPCPTSIKCTVTVSPFDAKTVGQEAVVARVTDNNRNDKIRI